MILGQDENKALLTSAIEFNIPTLLIGETGTGKTSIVRELAEKNGKELIRINLTGQTSTDEFLGKWLIKNAQTEWIDGALITAMKRGTWLVIDEINSALPEILFALHSLLDDHRAVMLSEKDGEIVTPDKEFRLFATMNPCAEYAGTKELNKAFLSRFGMVLSFDYPLPSDEVKILTEKTDETTAKLIVDVGNKLRAIKKAEEIFYTCSTRDLIQWALLVEPLGMEQAFKVAVLNKTDVDRQKVLDTYNMLLTPIEEKTRSYATKYITDVLKKIELKENAIKEKEKELKELEQQVEKAKEKILKELISFKAVEKVTKSVKRAKNETR